MHKQGWQLWAGLLLVGAGMLLVIVAWPAAQGNRAVGSSAAIPPTLTPEPIVPTRTPMGGNGTVVPIPTATSTGLAAVASPGIATPAVVATSAEPTLASPTIPAEPAQTAPTITLGTVEPVPVLPTPAGLESVDRFWLRQPRWGIGVAIGPITRYDVGPLRLGWYLDWQARSAPLRPGGIVYAQMIRLREGKLTPDAGQIGAIAQANPGSLWLVGNEPDVKWQDNVEPATYARLYREAHVAIKTADPTAQVAIGGVSQPTPLRLRYLDAILGSYRAQFGVEMPVDVWNVHNFVLQELRGSWGVDIPPGMSDDQGMLYEVNDSDNMAIFRQQVVDFRRWMAQRGYQDRPLTVSEYGILMPEDFGFSPARVASFMTSTFDYFLTAADLDLGYPADGHRLVQLWCWYSLDAPHDYYPTSNLFDPKTAAITPVGEAWVRYVE